MNERMNCHADTAQVPCFASKAMAQLSVFNENRFTFSDQNTMRCPGLQG
jgi:hypothetical protein